MIQLLKTGDDFNVRTNEYTCEALTDISNLPTNAPVHSTALLLSTGDIYCLFSNGQWIKIG